MSITEPQSADPPPEHRPFQFSLRSLFGLTCGIAAFFSLARTLGYVDALVILAAVVVAVGVMEYPRRVHAATGILLTLVAGTLLWANLRPTRWEKEFNQLPPAELGSVAKCMFYRGWPVSPCMICLLGPGMQLHATDTGTYVTLVFDGVVFVVALLIVRGVCESCLQRRGKLVTATSPSSPPPASSTSGPPAE